MSSMTINLRRATLLGRRIVGSLAARATGTAPEGRHAAASGEDFRAAIERAIAQLPAGTLIDQTIVHLPADRAPWFDTGMELDAGDNVTWVAAGRVHLSKLLDIYIEPHFQLWARVGEGDVFRGLRDTHSFSASTSGRLRLASYFPGQWSAPDGSFETPAAAWKGLKGGIDVAVLRWSGDTEAGLRALGGAGCERATAELARLRVTSPAPKGWRYLWFLGPSEIYSNVREDGLACIDCHTHCDVGILRRDVDVELTPETTIRWQWNVSELPSRLGEDLLPTHDYLSIAVEYDNGIDVTYYWSAELPVGEGYWCPLPAWKDREYHIVVRSGTQGLGSWHIENRHLFDDYQRYVGTPPKRIKRIWLIANSLFQRGHGRCRYADISIGGEHIREVVL